nr:hydroquinone glucosyltransferase-like isoform X1 [Ziziphus jujuba var. spinosa]XP_048320306.1 hydroquinone glucosyltransferase-like isoform X1 [Ziziphus jujuba var. spinosa]
MEDTQKKPPHVAIVPTPGMGHLIPLAELAKQLVLHYKFFVTFIVPSDGSLMEPHKKLLQALPETVSSIFLPHISFNDLPEDTEMEARIILSLIRSLPALRESLTVLNDSTRLVALVVDLLGVEALGLAKDFDVLPYIFFPSSMMVLSSIFYLPVLDETTSCEYRDLPEPIKLPGCVPIQGSDLVDALQDRKKEAYKLIIHNTKAYNMAAGIMVNGFVDLEPGAFKALEEGVQGNPPVFPVGPLIRTDSEVDWSECLSWLDRQPEGSVLFISFGSGGTLSREQLDELALGLEMSGQRFLWVVRSPKKAANANYFDVQSMNDDPFDFLPKGFLERTKEVGVVVQSWAPQVRVLNHGSTGGFISHCGWNSVLESIVHGVPLIAWPLYAEQKMNAVLLADDLKVALRVKLNDKGLVGSEDVAEYAKGLIEGEEGKMLRNRMKDLKEAASVALTKEGSSTKSLAEVVQIWNTHKN